jgi:hypothetical protein
MGFWHNEIQLYILFYYMTHQNDRLIWEQSFNESDFLILFYHIFISNKIFYLNLQAIIVDHECLCLSYYFLDGITFDVFDHNPSPRVCLYFCLSKTNVIFINSFKDKIPNFFCYYYLHLRNRLGLWCLTPSPFKS